MFGFVVGIDCVDCVDCDGVLLYIIGYYWIFDFNLFCGNYLDYCVKCMLLWFYGFFLLFSILLFVWEKRVFSEIGK